jgi:hypothetical protein
VAGSVPKLCRDPAEDKILGGSAAGSPRSSISRAVMLSGRSTITSLNRGVLKHAPLLEQAFRMRKRRVGGRRRMDETCERIRGRRYLHRATDKAGNTVYFL